MKYVIVITGASSGFGALAARALAKAGHAVYAPFGKRPSILPRNGSEVVTTVLDRIRAEFVRHLGFADLLYPAKLV